MIRVLSYSLLLSFFVLLTPRVAWHDCEHDEHHQQIEQSSETQAEQDDCLACEFDLGFFTINSPNFISYNDQVIVGNSKQILSSLNNFEGFSFSHRGPPVTV